MLMFSYKTEAQHGYQIIDPKFKGYLLLIVSFSVFKVAP